MGRIGAEWQRFLRRRIAPFFRGRAAAAPDAPIPEQPPLPHPLAVALERSLFQRQAQRGNLRPAVAIASPMPPASSGVADHTARLVEELGRHVDVDVYAPQADPRPAAGARAIRALSADAWLRPDYAATIAVLGNSPFHHGIVEMHARFGGACIVHDGRMIDYHAWRDGIAGARAVMARELGRAVTAAEVEGWLAAPDTLPTPCLDELLVVARPAVVHSRGIAALLAARGHRVEYVPFCHARTIECALLDDARRREARKPLGIPADTILVVSAGWVIPTKAPEAMVDAVSLLRRRGLPVHLRFVGNPTDMAPRMLARAADPDAISFTTGWVAEGDYRRHLIAADFGLQLRTLHTGAISAGLADCILAGLPTVATASLAAEIDAPDYVLRVADTNDPREIADRFAAAIAAGLHRSRHPAARQAYTADHSMAAYAERLLALLGLTSSPDRA